MLSNSGVVSWLPRFGLQSVPPRPTFLRAGDTQRPALAQAASQIWTLGHSLTTELAGGPVAAGCVSPRSGGSRRAVLRCATLRNAGPAATTPHCLRSPSSAVSRPCSETGSGGTECQPLRRAAKALPAGESASPDRPGPARWPGSFCCRPTRGNRFPVPIGRAVCPTHEQGATMSRYQPESMDGQVQPASDLVTLVHLACIDSPSGRSLSEAARRSGGTGGQAGRRGAPDYAGLVAGSESRVRSGAEPF